MINQSYKKLIGIKIRFLFKFENTLTARESITTLSLNFNTAIRQLSPCSAYNNILASNIYHKPCAWNIKFAKISRCISNIHKIFKYNVYDRILFFKMIKCIPKITSKSLYVQKYTNKQQMSKATAAQVVMIHCRGR